MRGTAGGLGGDADADFTTTDRGEGGTKGGVGELRSIVRGGWRKYEQCYK